MVRHLTASVLDDMGTPIGTIQRILGHQNRKTTEIYLHSVGDAERKAMDKLQEIDAFSNVESKLLVAPVNIGRSFLNRKVDRPPFEVLITEINELGYSAGKIEILILTHQMVQVCCAASHVPKDEKRGLLDAGPFKTWFVTGLFISREDRIQSSHEEEKTKAP